MGPKLLFSLFIIIILGITTVATTTNNSPTQVVQNIPAPPSNFFQEILNFIAQAYNWLVGLIQNILQATLLKQDPSLATTYANIIAWLVPLTALYVLLTLIEVIRKYLGYVIAAGWIFLIAVMILAH
jgi:hypothetical protein